MSYLPELRGALVQAAERQGQPAETAPPSPVGGTRRTLRSLTTLGGWARGGVGALSLAASVVVALVIAVLALTHLGGRPRPALRPPTASQGGYRRGAHGPRDVLGVLRRPQILSAHERQTLRSILRGDAFQGYVPELSLARRVPAPWGGSIYLAPERPSLKAFRAAQRQLPAHARLTGAALLRRWRALPDGVALVDPSGGAGCCSTEADIVSGHAVDTSTDQVAGGTFRSRIIAIVPDGVTQVAFLIGPSKAFGSAAAAQGGGATTIETVQVHQNIAAVQLDRPCCDSTPMIWYGPHGRVLKRIGNWTPASSSSWQSTVQATPTLKLLRTGPRASP